MICHFCPHNFSGFLTQISSYVDTSAENSLKSDKLKWNIQAVERSIETGSKCHMDGDLNPITIRDNELYSHSYTFYGP